MARRKDTPEKQRAKNYSGRRKGAEKRRAAAPEPAVSPEDALLASLDIEGLRPPARFATPAFAEELAVWRELVPRLKPLARLSAEFQAPLAAYCDSVARYNRACVTLEAQGLTVSVETVAGGSMLRMNPAEKIRQTALAEILALSDRFGLTPRDNFALLKDHRDLIERGFGQGQGSLFPQPRDGEPAPDAPAHGRSASLGAMDQFDSPPPRPH